MKLGNPIHSELLIEKFKESNVLGYPQNTDFQMSSDIGYKTKGRFLTIWWEIDVIFDGIKALKIAGFSTAEVISTLDYEHDTPYITLFLVESNGHFLDKVKEKFKVKPALEPNFIEACSRVLERLTDAGLY